MAESQLQIASDELLVELESRAALVRRRIDLPLSAIAVSIEDLMAVLHRLRQAETRIVQMREAVATELAEWSDDEALEKRIGEISVRELRIASQLIEQLSADVRQALSKDDQPADVPSAT